MVIVNPNGLSGNRPECFWSLGAESAPIGASLPPGMAFLWLDPAQTTPNVQLGVSGRGLGRRIMRPGDIVALPRGVTQVSLWNQYLNKHQNTYLGCVGFMALRAGTADELAALMASRGASSPAPGAAILWAGSVQLNYSPNIRTGNLRGVRVSCFPLNVAETAAAAAPADFAATLRPATQSQFSTYLNGPGSGVTPLPTGGTLNPADVGALDEPSPGQLAWADDLAMVASQYQMAWDREVVADGLLQIVPTAIAGTGISTFRIGIVVEGR